MLLEVSHAEGTAIVNGSFICSISVHVSVQSAIEHVTRVHRLREQLAVAVAAAGGAGASTVGQKRAHGTERLAEATALLSSAAVNRKNVLTVELLDAALVALSDETASTSAPPSSDCGLFFAGKWLEGDKLMSQYVGTNDKSKVKMVFRDGGGTASQTAPAEGAASASASTESVLPQVATGAVPSVAEDRGVSLIAYFKEQLGQPVSRRDDDGDARDDENADDEELPQLSARQADMLTASGDVRAALRDPRLQEVLRHIDSAPTREGALRRLEAALVDPDFEHFTQTALREIGIVHEGLPPDA